MDRSQVQQWKYPLLGSATAVTAAALLYYLRKKPSPSPSLPIRVKLKDGTNFDLSNTDTHYTTRPKIQPARSFVGGVVKEWAGKTVEVYSPITCNDEKVQIGFQAIMDEKDSLEALDAAVKSWDHGEGDWATRSIEERIKVVEKFVEVLAPAREEISKYLQWEICKSNKDADKEFDRTMSYIQKTCKILRKLVSESEEIVEDSGVAAVFTRAPLGVCVILGPFNYPFNETYCMLIPALLMGNSVVMKLPNIGSMAHIASMKAFEQLFPAGVVNFVTGSGRVTMPPLMRTGNVDVLGFIGGYKGADALMKQHPHPHRLTHILGLDAKNPAIVLGRTTKNPVNDDFLKLIVEQCVLGSTTYNGQRCTALKILFVHSSIVDEFLEQFNAAVDALVVGLPWTAGVQITPLAEPKKPSYLEELIRDAEEKGAEIVNERGGQRAHSILPPTVLYPVNKDMKIWDEEQFGPIIPVAPFDDVKEVLQYIGESKYGQQASIFGQDKSVVQTIVKSLVNMVARVNINSQCRRSPDTFPFTGRKNSAHGTLSVSDALHIFSLNSVVATLEKCKHMVISD